MTDLNGDELKARALAAADASFIKQGYVDVDGVIAKSMLADVLAGPIRKCVADSLNARDQVSLTRDQLMGIAFPDVPGRDQWDSQDDPELAQAEYDLLDTDVWTACNPGPNGQVQLKLNGGEGGLVLVRRGARKGHAGDVYVTRNKQCLMADVVNPQNKARTRRAEHEAGVIALLMGRVPEHAKAFDSQMTEGLNDAKSNAKAITKAVLVTLAAADTGRPVTTPNEGTGAASAAPTLDELAAEIRVEVAAVDEAKGSALAHAIRAGELLTQAKKRMGHGAWKPWLDSNFPDHRSTAARYMQLSANVARVQHLGSVREALAAIRSENKPHRAKRPKSNGATITGRPGLSHDPDVVAWVRKCYRAGWDRDRIVTASREGTGGWPRPGKSLTNGGVSECRAAIAAIESGASEPKRKPEAGKLLRDLQKRRKAGDDRDNKLWQARMDILQMLSDLERVDFPKHGIRDADDDTVVEIYEYLTLLDAWTQRSLVEVGAHVGDLAKLRLIRKLRDVKGRDPDEAKLFLAAADRLEAKRLGLKTG